MVIEHNKNNRRISIGLALCICGVSLGGLLKVAIGVNISWISTLIMIVSTILLINWRGIGHFRNVSKHVFFVYIYTIYTLILALFSTTGMMEGTVGIVYQIAYFVQILLVWGIDDDFNLASFLENAFWIFGIGTIAALLIINTRGFSNRLGALLARTEDASAVSRATTAFIAFCGFASALVYEPWNKAGKVARLVFIVSAIIVEVISARRSVLIVLFFVVCIHFFKTSRIKDINRKRLFKTVGALMASVIALIVIYNVNSDIKNAADRTFNLLVNGINTYLGRESSDMAAGYRRTRLDTIPDQFFNHSSIFQIVFGRGYNTDWLDIPFMQAFWDLGLLGGFLFIAIQGIVPLKYTLKRIDEPAIKFVQYYTLLRIIQNFSNGTPYGTFLPIIMLYTFLRIHHSQEDSERV